MPTQNPGSLYSESYVLTILLRAKGSAPLLSREDAIEAVREYFSFPTDEACLQFLKTHGVKGLPREKV